MGELDPERNNPRGFVQVATLITGKGTSGSWAIRGVQLGTAMDATVVPNARQLDGFDQIILCKRYTPELLERLRGRKVIWDVIDSLGAT